MIDITRPHPPLTAPWAKSSFLISLGLFAALPVAALLLYVVGGLLSAVGVLWIVVVYLVLYGIAALPVAAALGVVVAAANGAEQSKDKNAGCGVGCLGLALLIGLGFVVPPLWEWAGGYTAPNREATWKVVVATWEGFASAGSAVFATYLAYYVHVWAWLVLAGALAVTLGYLVVLTLARTDAVLRRTTRRVRYQCPHCPAREPEFVCPNPGCGTGHTDLAPTRHGIWTASCGRCRARLGTTGWSHRSRLEVRCAACKKTMSHPDLGECPELHLALVGAPGSGKTNLMVAALEYLSTTYAPGHQMTVVAGGATEDRVLQYWLGRRKVGTAEGPTPRSARPAAVTVSLRPIRGGGGGCLVYLYDPAGADVLAADDHGGGLAGHDFHAFLDGAVMVVDPLAEGLRGTAGAHPAATPAHEVLGRVFPYWQRVRGVAAAGRFTLPVAVAVTKMDALEGGGRLDLCADPADGGAPHAAGAARSADVRRFLADAGCGDLLQLVESHFTTVRYFATTALGRIPGGSDRSPLQARGAAAPFVWLLARAGGLTRLPAPLRAAVRACGYAARALRGLEGRDAHRRAWWGVALGAAAAAAAGGYWWGAWEAAALAAVVVAAAVAARSRVVR